ncbi:MAG: serine/threonine-protein kinase [Deltaproteobacteria bacterium]|nr:serine/threonine-protein kinase [Deltaproteobacteria bacterium]
MPAAADPKSNPVLAPGADLTNGFVVAEYVVEGVLGRGGMGAVYLASHPVIGKRVAIKVLSAALSFDPELVRRFVDEARAVNKIGHRNIIDIFSFGQLQDGRQYFIMEYLEGQTLAARLEAGPIPPGELSWIAAQACSALEAAHREHIVHRDLKPENLWLARPKHAEPYLKVLDFGIAKLADRADPLSATQTGTVMGTPHFMSPEQALGQKIDHRADIYAMGVVLYQALTRRMPFDGNTYAEIVSKLLTQDAPPILASEVASEPLRHLVMSCLEKDVSRRPASVADVGQKFASLASNLSSWYSPNSAQPFASSTAHLPNVATKVGFQENGDEVRRKLARPRSGSAWRAIGVIATLAVAVALIIRTMATKAHAPRVSLPQPSIESAPVQPTAAPIVEPRGQGVPPPTKAPQPPVVEKFPERPVRERQGERGAKGTPERPAKEDPRLIRDNPF